MTLDELCSMIVGISALNIGYIHILGDLINQVTKKIFKFDNNHLIQLLSAGNYIFKFKKHSGIYLYYHLRLLYYYT